MRFIYTKAFAIFAACLVFLVFLGFLQFKGWLEPIRKLALSAPKPVIVVTQNIVRPVINFFSTIYQLGKISEENGSLRFKVAELEKKLAEQNQQVRENEVLRKTLGFTQTSKTINIPCSVISQNDFGLSGTVMLDCGSDQGVSEGQAVISQGYLAGKIIYTGDKVSTVLLAVSSKFSIDASVSQTGSQGLVKGSFGSGMVLDQVPQTEDLQKGWLAVTAGINQQVPRNILIGEIGDLLSSGSDLFKKVALISPVDFNNLEFVLVVK